MVQCWDPTPMRRPSMDEVHERMKVLCQFFPEAEPLTMEDEEYEEDAVSFTQSIATSFAQLQLDLFLERSWS